MVAPGTAVGPLVPGISVVHIRMERQMSDATGVRGAAGGCRGPTTDRPGPVAADQTRYTFKVLNAARTKNIAMPVVGAAKAPGHWHSCSAEGRRPLTWALTWQPMLDC